MQVSGLGLTFGVRTSGARAHLCRRLSLHPKPPGENPKPKPDKYPFVFSMYIELEQYYLKPKILRDTFRGVRTKPKHKPEAKGKKALNALLFV